MTTGAAPLPKPAGPHGPTAAPPIAAVKAAPFTITGATASSPYLKMLVYAPPGAGKTTLAASAVDVVGMRDVLQLDAEGGEMTISDNARVINADKIDRIRITGFKMVAEVHKFLLAHCRYRDANDTANLRKLEAVVKGVPEESITEPKRYRTVIIDSLTELDQYCMYELLNIDQSKPITNPDDMNIAEWGQFRKNNQMMQLLIRALRDLPMNVILVCAAAYSQDELKRMHYTPQLTGQLKNQVQGFVDIVGYLVVGTSTDGKEQPRRLIVQPVRIPELGKFDAKCRRANFKGLFFEDPTMMTIMKQIGLAQE
jgi:hypothetical protein